MRHGMANKKLNRTSEHRKALLKNMLNSLIKYEQIKTTLPKAKFLKPQADKICIMLTSRHLLGLLGGLRELSVFLSDRQSFHDIVCDRHVAAVLSQDLSDEIDLVTSSVFDEFVHSD